MPIPDWIKSVRQHIGHQMLIVPGVSGIVINDAGQVLLQRRSDNGMWSVLGGVPEPGEEPADCIVREVLEETAVQCDPVRVVGVYLNPVVIYPNGDIVQYIITCFRCRHVAGEPRVNDDESLEVRYFDLNERPPMREHHRVRIAHALDEKAPTYFTPPTFRA